MKRIMVQQVPMNEPVKIEGFMNNKYSIVTLKDAAQLPCIGKRLIVTGNLSLQVEDSITIVPIKHI